MLHIALGFFLGDGWVQCLPILSWNAIWPCLLLAAAFAVAIYWLPTSWQRPLLRSVTAFAVGVLWAAGHAAWQLSHDLPQALEGQDLQVTGHVSSIPEITELGMRFEFTLDPIASDTTPPLKVRRILLTWYSPGPSVHAAEHWQLQVRLRRRHGYANPGGHDMEQQWLRDGINALGYVRASEHNRSLGMDHGKWVLRLRAALSERLQQALPTSPMQGLVRGLAVGDQQAIPDAAWQVFARTGTSHLVAISGSHIGMIGALLGWFGGALVRLPAAQRWRITRPMARAVFGMAGTLGYSLLAGMSVPTVRTLLMMCVYFGAQLCWRELSVWSNFGLALLLVLLVDPMAPLALGAWLSFGAVAVILLGCMGQVRNHAGWRAWLHVQGVVTIGLVPLLLLGFGALPLWSPLINLLAIPVFTLLLVPAVLIGCVLLYVIPVVGVSWLQATAHFMEWIYAVLSWAAQQPQAMWHVPQIPVIWIVLLCVGVLLMVLPLAIPVRICGVFCSLPALLFQPPLLLAGTFRLAVLDVGQGLAVVIHTRHHVLLYDAGPRFRSGRDTGELVVVPYLQSQGVQQLDAMMISHGDEDHAGGMRSVLDAMPVTQLLLGPSVTMPARQNNVLTCQRGQHWEWDGVAFQVLHPAADDTDASDNNSSCVLRIETGAGSALLLGDIEQRAERRLVSAGQMAPASIVVAAHHGSRSSSSDELVNATRPQWVIFSAGYRNRWNFPRAEVVQRWREAGASDLSTIEGGATMLTLNERGMFTVGSWRQQHPHYWN